MSNKEYLYPTEIDTELQSKYDAIDGAIAWKKQLEKVALVKSILAEHGIFMSVGGCGCNGSPWVSLQYKGELLLDDAGYCAFDMFAESNHEPSLAAAEDKSP